jgi:hypothetical protein
MPEARSRVAATLGRAGSETGLLWLKAFIWRNRRREPGALLDLTWSRASRLGWLFRGLGQYRNKWGHDWRELLYPQILERLDRTGRRCVPRVAVHGFDLVRASAAAKPTIVVAVHSPVDAVLNRLFDEAGISWVLLAQRAEQTERRARLLGLEGALEIIPQTSDALLSLRRALAEGRVVCACVDFAVRPDRRTPADLFVSPALFDLAKRTGAAVVYTHAQVMSDGAIEVTCAAPRIDPATVSPEGAAEDFVAWLRDDRGDRRSWGVRRWTEDRGARPARRG